MAIAMAVGGVELSALMLRFTVSIFATRPFFERKTA
jgi:hypothetical protein